MYLLSLFSSVGIVFIIFYIGGEILFHIFNEEFECEFSFQLALVRAFTIS